MFFVVATPIGNLEDITLRALRVLKESDLIVCEDTRQTSKLLQKYEITKPLLSYHAQSKMQKIEVILEHLKKGEKVALVSDAGTPGISDPGYLLIQKVLEMGVKIVPIPGPSAFLTALSASGLPIHEFIYLGFLPHKKGRETLFKEIAASERTIVFYESPYRILKTLERLQELCPEKQIVVGRELTKMFEEFFRGKVQDAFGHFSQNKILGEFVVIIH